MKKLAILCSLTLLLTFFISLWAQPVPQLTRGGGGGTTEGGSFTQINVTTQNVTYLTVVTQTVTTITYAVGNGGRLTINTNVTIMTNGTLTLSNLPPNTILQIGANQILTNIANSSGVLSNDGAGGFSWVAVSGGSGGSASVWQPNTALTYSGGSNLTIDGSGGTNFWVDLTNTAFFVTPANLPASKTSNTTFTVYFRQDSSGSRLVTWTNATFKWPGNAQFQPLTNANAISYVNFSVSPYTNSILLGDYGVLDLR